MQDDPICVAAQTDGKVLVTGLWVDHSFDIGMPVDPTSVSFSNQFSCYLSSKSFIVYCEEGTRIFIQNVLGPFQMLSFVSEISVHSFYMIE